MLGSDNSVLLDPAAITIYGKQKPTPGKLGTSKLYLKDKNNGNN